MGDPQLSVQAHIPQALQAVVVDAVERAQEERVAQRVRERDASLWGGPQAPEVADRLGWVDIDRRMLEELSDPGATATSLAAELREQGMSDVVLLGMGGSSLAPEVLRGSLRGPAGAPRLHVLDSTDASAVRAVSEAIGAERTVFVVSSKSGGTIEPLSMWAHFWAQQHERGERFVAITDPGSGLERLAREHGFRRVFHGDADIGGRYSALSPFGIVPALLAGLDAKALLRGAEGAWETGLELSDASGLENVHGLAAPVWLGAALAALARAGRDKLTFLVDQPLAGLGLWQEQLWAESTGKEGTGILPVWQGQPGDGPARWGEDRVFVELVDVAGARIHTRARQLHGEGHPAFTIPVQGPADLGRVFLLSEIAVAVAGWGLGINPFDQPDVQRAKDATARALEAFEREGSLPEVEEAGPEQLRALLAGVAPPEYVAIMGYVQPSEEFDAAVAELRGAITAKTGAACTFGYGPRFLHSTGQFHKGGPRVGRFLQLIHDGPEDIQIPDRGYSFDTLKNAQATGDLLTLRELGRPAERVRLSGADPAGGLRALCDTIREVL